MSKRNFASSGNGSYIQVWRRNQMEAINLLKQCLPLRRGEVAPLTQGQLLRLAAQFVKLKHSVSRSGFQGTPFDRDFIQNYTECKFIIVSDGEGTIMFCSESITNLLGPKIVDTIGINVADLVHEDDKCLISENLQTVARNGVNTVFVTRMCNNLAPLQRSKPKHVYKNVLVSLSLLKRPKNPEDSPIVVLTCYPEDHIGLPEIVINSHYFLDVSIRKGSNTCVMVDVDPKVPWISGFSCDYLIGKDSELFRHPGDVPTEEQNILALETLKRDGFLPPITPRFTNACGQWGYIRCSVRLTSIEKDGTLHIRVTCTLLGPSDEMCEFAPTMPIQLNSNSNSVSPYEEGDSLDSLLQPGSSSVDSTSSATLSMEEFLNLDLDDVLGTDP